MNFTQKTKTTQFLIFQNKAYHEDNLINSKALLDTKMKDYSYILNSQKPSKKLFLERERNRDIEKGNKKLLNKIYSIIYDKNKQIVKKYRPEVTEKSKFLNTKISFHPFCEEHKAKTLNFGQRKRENDRICQDNLSFLNRLKNSKPRILNVSDAKNHDRKCNKYAKNIRIFDPKNRPKSVLIIHDRHRLSPALDQFIKRRERTSDNHESTNVTSMLNDQTESRYIKKQIRGRSAKTQPMNTFSSFPLNLSLPNQDQIPSSEFKKENGYNLEEKDVNFEQKLKFEQSDIDYRKLNTNKVRAQSYRKINQRKNYSETLKDISNSSAKKDLNHELFDEKDIDNRFRISSKLIEKNFLLANNPYDDDTFRVLDNDINETIKNIEEFYLRG